MWQTTLVPNGQPALPNESIIVYISINCPLGLHQGVKVWLFDTVQLATVYQYTV